MHEAEVRAADGPSARAKVVIAALIAVKVLICAWNAFAMDGPSYDHLHHVNRALVGGLKPGVMYYDGPLYYLPALAFKPLVEDAILRRDPRLAAALADKRAPLAGLKAELKAAKQARAKATSKALAKRARAEERKSAKALAAAKRSYSKVNKRFIKKVRAEISRVLRATNVLYIAIFYVCWIWIALPRLLPNAQSWVLASMLLLALPGYQKLGVMIHADNLFAATSALCVALWSTLRERDQLQPGSVDRGWWLSLPLAAGAVGMTRPFAAAPIAVFSAVACLHILTAHRSWRTALPRVAVALAIVGTLSLSWYTYRWANTGQVTNAYKKDYIAKYAPYRSSVDFVDYFTSFRFGELLSVPNRRAPGPVGAHSEPSVANSFLTLLYSETWGDHWLYFSGTKGVEGKLWPKRVLFTLALPVPALLIAGFVCSVRATRRRLEAQLAHNTQHGLARAVAIVSALERELVIATWLVLGAALYLYWQTGPALLPGKNSTIKFTYIATLYPLVIVLASSFRPGRRAFYATGSYLFVLFLASLPVARL